MKKKTKIIIAASVALVAVILVVLWATGVFNGNNNNSNYESTEKQVKTIKVGNYTLKLGKYKSLTSDKEDEPLLILEDGYWTYEDDEDTKLEYTIGGNELLYLGHPFFLVTANDEIELEAGGGIKYAYVGEAGSTSTNVVKNSSNKTTNTSKNNTTTKSTTKTENGVKIKQANTIKLVNYNGGEFTMQIPDGWKVSKGGTGMFYGVRVYDPSDDRNQIFYVLKEQPFYKSANAESLYKMSMGYCPGIYIGGDPTTEQIFKMNNTFANKAKELQSSGKLEYKGFEFPNINNFTVIDSSEGNSVLHNQAVDDKVLRATFNNGGSKGNGEAEGLFNACVVDFGTLGYGNDQFSYYMAYNVSGITTAKDELVNYEEILLQSLNSLKFSAKYSQTTVDATNKQTNNALNVSNQLSQSYKSYNDAWSNRQKSYDIQSQKRSDATLGYERVIDTETGEIYKAYNGFMDDYSGKRYQAITDSQYTEKITGYIEK